MGSRDNLMGLARPSIEGPLFIYRAPIQLGGPSASRVQIRATTHSSPEPILSAIASRFEDLADPVQVEPWRLLPIDTSRGMSRNRELQTWCCLASSCLQASLVCSGRPGSMVTLWGPGCMPGRLLVWTDPYAEHGGSGTTSQWHSPF